MKVFPRINVSAVVCLKLLRTFSIPWISFSLAAATTSGVINQDETWSGRILLTGDVTVPTNVTLTLLPGTRVECAPGFDDRLGGVDGTKIELIIAGGSFTAVGTAEEPIVITSAATAPNRSHWYGVRATSAMVTLNHCELRYAYTALTVEGGAPPQVQNTRFFYSNIGASLNLPGNTMSFQNCTFDYNSFAALIPHGATKLRLVSSVVDKGGVGIRQGDSVELIDCTISDNVGGWIIHNVGEIVVRDSRFLRNTSGILAGTAWITNSVFASNVVAAVEGSGVMAHCRVEANGFGYGAAVSGNFELYHCDILGNESGVSGVRLIANSTITDNRGSGANCETIVDSAVEGNGDIGVTAVNVTNCVVRSNGGGVLLSGQLCTMTDSLVESNQFGVLVSSSWPYTNVHHVTGCTVVRKGGTGIGALPGAGASRTIFSIQNCTVSENVLDGISGRIISVTGNLVAGNGEAGIRIVEALQPGAITGNVIQSNRVGLLAVFPAQSLSDTGISSNIISENLEYEISNLSSGVIIADGNYWGEPTTTELNGAVANLTKIHDSHDAPASAGQVLIRSWNDSPVGGGPVVIVQGLEDKTVNAGAEVSWVVVAEGEGELVYQWFKDGAAIGDHGDTLQLGPVDIEDAGVYSVVVGNSFVSAGSSARLTVAGENAPPPPVLDLASFAGLTVYGTPGKSYQVQYGTDPDTPVWVPLTNITLSTTHYFFVDTESAGPGRRFYRVVELPDSSP